MKMTLDASKRRERRYNLTPERLEAAMKEQNGLCAVCRRKPPTDVDHSAKTGHFRGLLCRACNLGLGMFADDPELMGLAIGYLSKPTTSIAEQFPQRKRFLKPYPRGEHCHNSKLTWEIVRLIRAEYAVGDVHYSDLGKKYGLHKVTVGTIVRGEAWPEGLLGGSVSPRRDVSSGENAVGGG